MLMPVISSYLQKNKFVNMKSNIFSKLALSALVFCSSFVFAGNPIISQRYTADPVGIEYKGRLYIYASHDLDGQKRYSMNDFTCVSTADLVNWTDHGEVFKVKEVTDWAQNSWAPSIAYRNGKFYLYFGDANRCVGVAVSDSPIGPFKDVKGGPMITRDLPNANVPWCYDPTTFIDPKDGQAYCVFGGGPLKTGSDGKLPKNARIIRLKEDMITPEGSAVTIDAPRFYEGAYIHAREHNGVTKYYFSYFAPGKSMNIDYMMSDSPTEGWKYMGTVLEQPKDNFNNTHASIFPFKDKWYMAYHTRKVGNDRKIDAIRQRCVCIDELEYNDDYTIKPVVATSEGPAQLFPLNPYERVEAETMAAQSYLLPGIQTFDCDDKGGGRMVGEIDNGDWIKVAGVNFGNGARKFIARVKAADGKTGNIEIRLDSEKGELVGICKINGNGEWKDYKCRINGTKGKHDLFFVFKGNNENMFEFNYWKFIK